MRAEWIKEMGLSPLWVRRPSAAAPPSSFSESEQRARPAAENPPPAAKTAAKTDSASAAKSAAGTDSVSKSPPPPDESAIARMQWQPLREAAAECRRCGLCENRTQAVFGVGDADADIFFVGEGPGYEEDRRGEPFVGPAGRLLDAMLQSIGMGRDRGIYIANIVKCRPPKNRNPKPEEARACMAYLRRQIELASPRLIVALGGVAAAHLLQTEETVGKLRQRMHEYHGIPLAVTYHPAYLLRAPAEKRKSWNDLRHIRRLAAKTA